LAVKISDYLKSKKKADLEITKNQEISDDVWASIDEGQVLSGRTGTSSEGKSYRAVRFNPKNTTNDADTDSREVTELTLIEITGGIEEPWEDYRDIVINSSGTTKGTLYRPFQGYYHSRTINENYFLGKRENSAIYNNDLLFNKFPGIRKQTS